MRTYIKLIHNKTHNILDVKPVNYTFRLFEKLKRYLELGYGILYIKNIEPKQVINLSEDFNTY